MMDNLRILKVIEIIALKQARVFEQPLDAFGAIFGQDDRALLLINFIVFWNKIDDHRLNRLVKL